MISSVGGVLKEKWQNKESKNAGRDQNPKNAWQESLNYGSRIIDDWVARRPQLW